MFDWKPIELAPDNTMVLVAHFTIDNRFFWAQAGKRGYDVSRSLWFTPTGRLIPKPTHWMPLNFSLYRCNSCRDTGLIPVGTSGSDADGNAMEFASCDQCAPPEISKLNKLFNTIERSLDNNLVPPGIRGFINCSIAEYKK